MDLTKYMTFTVKHKPFLGLDEDTRRPSYGEEVDIKCFTYGKDIFIRDTDRGSTVSARVYLTAERVNTRDIIDGQVVKGVNENPSFWGPEIQLYEVLTWED